MHQGTLTSATSANSNAANHRTGGGQAMPPRTHGHWLQVETVGEVAVGRLTQCRILNEDAVEQAGTQLLGLMESTGCKKVVLDLGTVEGMSTAFMGKLVALHRQVEAAGGRLVLCQVRPALLEVFTICRFNKLVQIYAGEQEALQSF